MSPAKVAVDETVIHFDDKQLWLYAAVDPATNRLLHVRLFPARTTVVTKPSSVNSVGNTSSTMPAPVDRGPWLQATLYRLWLDFHHETHGRRDTAERVS